MARKKKTINYSEKYFNKNTKIRDSLAILYVYSTQKDNETVCKMGISRVPLSKHIEDDNYTIVNQHTDTLYNCWKNLCQLQEQMKPFLHDDGFYRNIGKINVTDPQTE